MFEESDFASAEDSDAVAAPAMFEESDAASAEDSDTYEDIRLKL